MSFKIGDKVRYIPAVNDTFVYTVRGISTSGKIQISEGGISWPERDFSLVTSAVDTEQSIATGVFVVVDKEYEDTIVQAFGTALDALKAVNGEQYYRAYFMPYGAYKGWEDIK